MKNIKTCVKPDVISYNTLLKGWSHSHDIKKAFLLFN